MKRLYDASSIVNLVVRGGEEILDQNLTEGHVLSLTYFEIGNSVWKMHSLLKSISDQQADSILVACLQLNHRMELLHFDAGDGLDIERLAFETKNSFYDASYLYAAKKNSLVLVTEDKRLAKSAMKEKIDVKSASSLFHLS